MVVGEGWIVVVVGGFVFTDVVCVLIWFLLWLLHLLFVSCSFFLLQVVMPVVAVVAFVIVVVSVLVAVAPSAAHCCGLLRSLPHLLRLFCFPVPVPASSRFVPAGVCCRGGPVAAVSRCCRLSRTVAGYARLFARDLFSSVCKTSDATLL